LNNSKLFIVAAPSGGGKTSLIRALLAQDSSVSLSVSHTTRAPRPAEQDGIDYHFVDNPTFLQLVRQNAFIEHAQVFDHRYGTAREPVEAQLAAGYAVLLDIDWQGARQIRENISACRSIFILPPSIKVLRQRLSQRGQDSEDVIERRMRAARDEISHWSEFDFLIINDDFDQALADLLSIIRHGKPKRPVQKDRYNDLLAELLKNG
jgi:guanylate kinase